MRAGEEQPMEVPHLPTVEHLVRDYLRHIPNHLPLAPNKCKQIIERIDAQSIENRNLFIKRAIGMKSLNHILFNTNDLVKFKSKELNEI
jgi:hypothetical protein